LIFSIDLVFCVLHILFGIGVLNFLRETEQKELIGNIDVWMIVGDTNRRKTASMKASVKGKVPDLRVTIRRTCITFVPLISWKMINLPG